MITLPLDTVLMLSSEFRLRINLGKLKFSHFSILWNARTASPYDITNNGAIHELWNLLEHYWSNDKTIIISLHLWAGKKKQNLWLANRACKIRLSWRFEISSCVPKKYVFDESHNRSFLWLTNLLQSRWLHIGIKHFFQEHGLHLTPSTRKTDPDQNPAILISRLAWSISHI